MRTCPGVLRWAHFVDEIVAAVNSISSPGGTRKPLISGLPSSTTSGHANVTITTPAWGRSDNIEGPMSGVEQSTGDRCGCGHHHGIGLDPAPFACHHPPLTRAVQLVDRFRQAQVRSQRIGQCRHDAAHPVGVGREHGPARTRGAGPHGGQRADEARMVGRRRELGDGGGEAELLDVSGVDASQQRTDQALEHLVTHPTTNESADGVLIRVLEGVGAGLVGA